MSFYSVVDDVEGLFNSDKNVFDASSVSNLLKFAWTEVAIFYMMLSLTSGSLLVGIWGFMRDKADSIKILPEKDPSIESNTLKQKHVTMKMEDFVSFASSTSILDKNNSVIQPRLIEIKSSIVSSRVGFYNQENNEKFD